MLNIRRSDLQKIFAHCESEYPNEACGILSGSDNKVDTVYSLLNENPSPTFYRIDSKDHFRVIREMREKGKELIGIYHSHTGSQAYPSPTDVQLAYYPAAVYVIVSLMNRKNPDVRGYIICENAITEVPLNIL